MVVVVVQEEQAPQSSAADHKPLAPNWQLEAVGGGRAQGLG